MFRPLTFASLVALTFLGCHALLDLDRFGEGEGTGGRGGGGLAGGGAQGGGGEGQGGNADRRLDPVTCPDVDVVGLTAISATVSVSLTDVVIGPDREVYVAGLFEGALTLPGVDASLPGEGPRNLFVARLEPSGDASHWFIAGSTGGAPELHPRIAVRRFGTDTRVFLATTFDGSLNWSDPNVTLTSMGRDGLLMALDVQLTPANTHQFGSVVNEQLVDVAALDGQEDVAILMNYDGQEQFDIGCPSVAATGTALMIRDGQQLGLQSTDCAYGSISETGALVEGARLEFQELGGDRRLIATGQASGTTLASFNTLSTGAVVSWPSAEGQVPDLFLWTVVWPAGGTAIMPTVFSHTLPLEATGLAADGAELGLAFAAEGLISFAADPVTVATERSLVVGSYQLATEWNELDARRWAGQPLPAGPDTTALRVGLEDGQWVVAGSTRGDVDGAASIPADGEDAFFAWYLEPLPDPGVFEPDPACIAVFGGPGDQGIDELAVRGGRAVVVGHTSTAFDLGARTVAPAAGGETAFVALLAPRAP